MIEGESAQNEPVPLADLRESAAYVLLGDPGAGKSRALEHEADHTPYGKYVRALVLLQGGDLPNDCIPFIDALDEVRVGGGDRFTPIASLLKRLREQGIQRFRLSCREADWFDKTDRASFESLLPGDSSLRVAYLMPFEAHELEQLIGACGEPDPQSFISLARSHGLEALLTNPQTTTLLIKAKRQGGWPASKADVYRLACAQLAREANDIHLEHSSRQHLSDETVLDAAAALCAALLLSTHGAIGLGGGPHARDVVARSSLPVSLIASPEATNAALSSRLFSARPGAVKELEPVHRTVAEYLAARHLANRMNDGLSVRRVLALTSIDGRVVSSLRGLNAWLATWRPSECEQLIEADPLGVALYGDAKSFSTFQKQQVFECLAREARQSTHFRMGQWHQRPSPALAGKAMAGYFGELMASPARDPAHLALLSVVLETLWGARSLVGLEPAVLQIAHGTQLPADLRELALATWLASEPAAEAARQQLERLDQELPRPDKLIEYLLKELYPERISLAVALRYVPSRERENPRSWHFLWGRKVARDTPDHLLPEAAETLLKHDPRFIEDGVERDEGSPHLLLRLLQVHGDNASAAQLCNWLSLALNRQGYVLWSWQHDEELPAIRGWLADRPETYKAMLAYLLEQTPLGDSQRAQDHLNHLHYRFLQAPPPADLGQWYLDQAREWQHPILLKHALSMSISCLVNETAANGLDIDQIDRWCQETSRREPDVLDWQKELFVCDLPSIEVHRQSREQMRLGQQRFENRRSSWIEPYRQNLASLQAGEAPVGLLHQLAMVWKGRLIEADGDSGHERLSRFFDDDPSLIHAAKVALRAAYRRPDLPKVQDILAIENESRRHLIADPCLIAAEFECQENAEAPSQWNDALAVRLLAFRFTDGTGEDPSWLETLIDERPDLVAEVYLAYLSGRIRSGHSYIYAIHRLTEGGGYAPVATRVMLPLLQAWPTRNKSEQCHVRQQVHDAAWAYLMPDDLKLLARQRLALRSLESAQRIYWLAVQAALAEGRAMPRLLTELASSQSACDEFLAVANLPGLHHQLTKLPLPEQSSLWQCVGRWVQPREFPRDAVTEWLNGVAIVPSDQSTVMLDDWLCDASLSAWHAYVRDLRYQQRMALRDSRYSPPSLEAVAEALAKHGPANAADLKSLVEDQLTFLQADLVGGNTNRWQNFWDFDDAGRTNPTEPLIENVCRDRIKEALEPDLQRFNITLDKERAQVSDSRCDLHASSSIDGQRVTVPIEIKRTSNDQLWTGLRTQLIEKYSLEPSANGMGIYLVLWFGQGRIKPHKDRLPVGTPAVLRRLLFDSLSFDEQSRISVVVLDVSPPKRQTR